MADTTQTVPVSTTTLKDRIRDPVLWFTLASAVVGTLVGLGVIGDGSVVVKVIGLIGAVLTTLGFKVTDMVKTTSANKAAASIAVASIQAKSVGVTPQFMANDVTPVPKGR